MLAINTAQVSRQATHTATYSRPLVFSDTFSSLPALFLFYEPTCAVMTTQKRKKAEPPQGSAFSFYFTVFSA
jgi:hypothetical protein